MTWLTNLYIVAGKNPGGWNILLIHTSQRPMELALSDRQSTRHRAATCLSVSLSTCLIAQVAGTFESPREPNAYGIDVVR